MAQQASNPSVYYDVFPRIVRAGSSVDIRIRPLFDHVRFKEDRSYSITLIPIGGAAGQMQWPAYSPLSLTPQGGELCVPCQFADEQEYVLLVERDGKTLADFRLYALQPDLYNRRPFKGDFHMHTFHSDGVESPAYVAAACRKIGMDFMAITDHRQYEPSLEAMHAFQGLDIDLRIYPGEEIHPPDNKVHMLNFGGSFSINALFEDEAYQQEVQAIMDQLEDFPAGVDRYPYASCVWCFNKIRAGGGLGVFCHPYWISRHHTDVPQALVDLLFDHQPYDAYEVIGGYHYHELEANIFQVARYHEERSQGKRIPIVGVSDAHGCETGSLFGWYYTIAFSPSSDLPDLVQSIKDLYSVAVEALPGERSRAFGPVRLVQYAHFLMREFFPWHDQICVEEGRLMLAHAAGDPASAAALKPLMGRVQNLYRHWWG